VWEEGGGGGYSLLVGADFVLALFSLFAVVSETNKATVSLEAMEKFTQKWLQWQAGHSTIFLMLNGERLGAKQPRELNIRPNNLFKARAKDLIN
jgi:hypothetical protein